ncbi:MAG: hypothetical protein IJ693_12060 [Bacteroidaceae bacterium]|nr:hypothetical protein [Bacteroidaceae bacterium]
MKRILQYGSCPHGKIRFIRQIRCSENHVIHVQTKPFLLWILSRLAMSSPIPRLFGICHVSPILLYLFFLWNLSRPSPTPSSSTLDFVTLSFPSCPLRFVGILSRSWRSFLMLKSG